MEAVTEKNAGIDRQIISLSQDAFYRELNSDEIVLANKGSFNFDHPGTHERDICRFLESTCFENKTMPDSDRPTNEFVDL